MADTVVPSATRSSQQKYDDWIKRFEKWRAQKAPKQSQNVPEKSKESQPVRSQKSPTHVAVRRRQTFTTSEVKSVVKSSLVLGIQSKKPIVTKSSRTKGSSIVRGIANKKLTTTKSSSLVPGIASKKPTLTKSSSIVVQPTQPETSATQPGINRVQSTRPINPAETKIDLRIKLEEWKKKKAEEKAKSQNKRLSKTTVAHRAVKPSYTSNTTSITKDKTKCLTNISNLGTKSNPNTVKQLGSVNKAKVTKPFTRVSLPTGNNNAILSTNSVGIKSSANVNVKRSRSLGPNIGINNVKTGLSAVSTEGSVAGSKSKTISPKKHTVRDQTSSMVNLVQVKRPHARRSLQNFSQIKKQKNHTRKSILKTPSNNFVQSDVENFENQENRIESVAEDDNEKPRVQFNCMGSPTPPGRQKITTPFKMPPKQHKTPTSFKSPQRQQKIVAPCKTPPIQQRTITPCKTPPKKQKTPLSQFAMRQKLDSWLESKGKTPSCYKHLRCFGADVSAQKKGSARKSQGGLSAKDLSKQQMLLDNESLHVSDGLDAADNAPSINSCDVPNKCPPISDQEVSDMLDECSSLLDLNCPSKDVASWMDQIEKTFPSSCSSMAKYWMCKVRLAELSGSDNDALSCFEKAVRHDAKPAEFVSEELQKFVTRMSDRQKMALESCSTPRKQRINTDNIFESSAIKYLCRKATTPFFKKLRQSACGEDTIAVITPVRRSTRRSLRPEMLQDHDLILTSLSDIGRDETKQALFQDNKSLNIDRDIFETDLES